MGSLMIVRGTILSGSCIVEEILVGLARSSTIEDKPGQLAHVHSTTILVCIAVIPTDVSSK